MTMQRLTCPLGHTWEQTVVDRLPNDLREICPVCARGGEPTVDVRTPTAPIEPADGPLGPGRVLAGFEILEELNRGGMGIVYKARQHALNRVVALKVIMPEYLQDADARKRFAREVQAAARLSHPNIVTVYYTDLEGPRPFLAMEYVSGIDLHRLIRRVGPLPVNEACTYILQAAQGLEHVHEEGLVHRDIKPANLMVTPSPLDPRSKSGRGPTVKILDLGLARMTTKTPGESEGAITEGGMFLGTPDFVSPEQAEDSRQADIRSDLYSLGCTLYFLLTAEVPFPSSNVMQKLRRQLTEDPPSASQRRPQVPASVDAVVRRLMARDPAERFQTPTELRETLSAVLRDPTAAGGPAAPPPTPPPTSHFATPEDLRGVLELLAVEDDSPSSFSAGTRVKGHAGGVQSLRLSVDGQVLLTGGLDQRLRVWEADRLRETLCIRSNVGLVEQVCMTPRGKWAVSCSLKIFQEEMVVQMWDLASGKEVRRLKGLTAQGRCVAISPDGRRVAAGGDDKTIRIWTVDKPGSPSLCLQGHTDRVTCLVFLSAGDGLLSGSQDGTVRLWDSKTGEMKKTFPGEVGPITTLAYAGTSRRLALAGSKVRIRQANGSSTLLVGHQGPVLSLAFSVDGELLLSGGSDQTVRLWRAADGTALNCLRGHSDKVRAVALSPDGQAGYSGSADGNIHRWNLLK